jgi:hypothetical protein
VGVLLPAEQRPAEQGLRVKRPPVVGFLALGNTTRAFQLGKAAGTVANGAPGAGQGEVLATYDSTAAAPSFGHLFNDDTIFDRTSDPGADPRAVDRAVRIGFRWV